MKKARNLSFVLLLLLGCETGVPGPGPIGPGVLVDPFNGNWDMLIYFPTGEAFACFTVQNQLVISFYDTCLQPNIVISPAQVLYDSVGPYFSFYWSSVGNVTFYFTRINNGLYTVELHSSGSVFFGDAVRY